MIKPLLLLALLSVCWAQDSCSSAQTLERWKVVHGDTTGAPETLDSSAFATACNALVPSPAQSPVQWYSYVPTSDGSESFTISTCGSSFLARIRLIRGSRSQMDTCFTASCSYEVASISSCPNGDGEIFNIALSTMFVNSDQIWWIGITGDSGTEFGKFDLVIDERFKLTGDCNNLAPDSPFRLLRIGDVITGQGRDSQFVTTDYPALRSCFDVLSTPDDNSRVFFFLYHSTGAPATFSVCGSTTGVDVLTFSESCDVPVCGDFNTASTIIDVCTLAYEADATVAAGEYISVMVFVPEDGSFQLTASNDCAKSEYFDVICQQCHPSCGTCMGPLATDCITCDESRFLNNVDGTHVGVNTGSCVPDCNVVRPGTFGDETAGSCRPCTDCETCFDRFSNSCDSCSATFGTWTDFECWSPDVCAPGSFADETTFYCEPCDLSCATCSNAAATDCLSCDQYSYLTDDGRCVHICPDGTYEDTATGRCMGCDVLCPTCFGGSSSECFTCVSTHLWENYACLPDCTVAGLYADPDQDICLGCAEDCLTCEDGTDCTSCESPLFLEGGRCLSVCPEMKWRDSSSQSCEDCDPTCATCAGDATTCGSCSGSRYLFNNACILEPCPVGFYADASFNNCRACHQSCASGCVGPSRTQCL